ncbi:MAG: four helix bundle protein [Phycisphaerae bacterium]|nr:four helix bundle protein [Phycisphaerae bacterium]
MGRLDPNLLARFEGFCDRMVGLAEDIEREGRSRRVSEQVLGAGAGVGANLFEADEALSRKDFAKCVGIALKEINERRFWLRLASRRAWRPEPSLSSLLTEAEELKRILGAILTRTRRADAATSTR